MSSSPNPSKGPTKGPPPPVFPPVDQNFVRARLRLLAWMRVGLGALAGIVSGVAGFVSLNPPNGDQNAYYGFYVAFFVYIASYYIAKYPLGLKIMQKDKTKLFTQGIGSFIMMFLFFWILYNTILYLGVI